ncbi:rRNA maturation RNase YbeY [Psychromonas sp. MB-3u-54]|uniref:rRNA maturation RNase YbeY n=1 Tax=Psychromonas sp. MB-3u-54 TaxID=2058319 RepID=UPI000C31E5F5|nr:rRNA maturation RNase YbeY [Psychromonas sp. MB-3u-54]PKH03307.1 rRNA maturation RNase YbeY [Psychromonas sp. MB-3u-54]
MQLYVDLQIACSDPNDLPILSSFEKWIKAAILGGSNSHQEEAELTVRIVDPDEIMQLNHQYRNMNKPTNVLAFPFQNPPGLTLPLLGDLIICKEVVENEAKLQGKTLTAHWAHMSIHSTLHLLGYDHIDQAEAVEMESLETKLLTELGFTDPYLSEKE